MDEKFKYIDDVVRGKLDGYQAKTAFAGWMKLNDAMVMKRFFKFSIVRFNVYYAVMVLTGAVSGTYWGVNYASNGTDAQGTKLEYHKENVYEQYARDIAIPEDSTFVFDNQELVQPIAIPEKKEIDTVSNVILEVNEENLPDDARQKKKVVKVIRKKVLIKDTIHKKDTVIVKKIHEEKDRQK